MAKPSSAQVLLFTDVQYAETSATAACVEAHDWSDAQPSWLDSQGTEGLGAHLHRALGGAIPVVGVAKTAYQGSAMALPLVRGASLKPLFVTSIGLEPERALEQARRLHGPWRIPTLLKAVDALARHALAEVLKQGA